MRMFSCKMMTLLIYETKVTKVKYDTKNLQKQCNYNFKLMKQGICYSKQFLLKNNNNNNNAVTIIVTK